MRSERAGGAACGAERSILTEWRKKSYTARASADTSLETPPPSGASIAPKFGGRTALPVDEDNGDTLLFFPSCPDGERGAGLDVPWRMSARRAAANYSPRALKARETPNPHSIPAPVLVSAPQISGSRVEVAAESYGPTGLNTSIPPRTHPGAEIVPRDRGAPNPGAGPRLRAA